MNLQSELFNAAMQMDFPLCSNGVVNPALLQKQSYVVRECVVFQVRFWRNRSL